MKYLLVLCAFAQFCWSKPNNTTAKSLVEAINSKKLSWRAGVNFAEGTPKEYLSRRLGFLGVDSDPNRHVEIRKHKIGRTTIPEKFDARERWPVCKDVIDNIRDQGNCGSCWAFSSAEVMSDRLCIQTNGELKFEFSAQELISCCSYCGYGCDGGYTNTAWIYWEQQGIVSGGDYNSSSGCKPYERIAYYNNTTPSCKTSCQNANYETPYDKDGRYGDFHYMLTPLDEQQIQQEILINGSVQASYSVYEDFALYQDGVYHYEQGEKLGGHAIKIIGWGVSDDGVKYWLVANSWGTTFGIQGYFKIRRGTNECGIEERVFAGQPYLGPGRDPKDESDPGPGGSAIKIVSSGFALLLSGLIFFIAFE